MAYKMPPVDLNEPVLWYPGGDMNAEPAAAIVSRLGHDNVCLNVISPSSYNFQIKDGVRHVSDPRKVPVEVAEIGMWDYSNRGKLLRKLEKDLLGVKP